MFLLSVYNRRFKQPFIQLVLVYLYYKSWELLVESRQKKIVILILQKLSFFISY